MSTFIFETPIVREGPAGGHRLFHFYKLDSFLRKSQAKLSFLNIIILVLYLFVFGIHKDKLNVA